MVGRKIGVLLCCKKCSANKETQPATNHPVRIVAEPQQQACRQDQQREKEELLRRTEINMRGSADSGGKRGRDGQQGRARHSGTILLDSAEVRDSLQVKRLRKQIEQMDRNEPVP